RSISNDKHIEVTSRTSQSQQLPETEQEQLADLEDNSHGLGTYENLLSLGYIKTKIPEQFGYLEVHGFKDIHQEDVSYKQFPNAVEASKKAMDKAVDDLRIKKPQRV